MRLILSISLAALLFGAAVCRAQAPAAPKDPALRAELARRIKADQDARFALIRLLAKVLSHRDQTVIPSLRGICFSG